MHLRGARVSVFVYPRFLAIYEVTICPFIAACILFQCIISVVVLLCFFKN